MIYPIFYGLTGKGELNVENKPKFLQYLLSLSRSGKPAKIEIIIKRYRKKRTNRQNSLYWLWLNFIAEETGSDPDELHVYFKSKYLLDRSGKIPVVKSTTRLTTVEFSEYMDKITREVANVGITLPNPEDLYMEDYNFYVNLN